MVAFICYDGLEFSPQWKGSHLYLFKSVDYVRTTVDYWNAAILCELHICTLSVRLLLYGGYCGRVFVFEKREKRIAIQDPFLRKL